jgi:hypothetical protein
MNCALVCTVALAGCQGVDRQANQRPTQTTDAPDATRGESDLGRRTLEWLLSPTLVCPAPPHVRPFAGDGTFGPMLELLGLAPTPPDRCLEGVSNP